MISFSEILSRRFKYITSEKMHNKFATRIKFEELSYMNFKKNKINKL